MVERQPATDAPGPHRGELGAPPHRARAALGLAGLSLALGVAAAVVVGVVAVVVAVALTAAVT